MVDYSISNARVSRGRLDLNVLSHSLYLLSNNNRLLVSCSCDRKEYLCRQPSVWLRLTVDGE